MENNEATEINDVTPSSLSHLIGQRGVIDQVRVALDAAQMDGKKFDHAMLVGPPGLGKSILASCIAQEMATDLHEVLGQSIKNVADLNVLLLAAKDKDVVHIDECHELGKEFQTALYLAVDKRRLIIQGGKTPMTLPLSDFTLLLSTTDEYSLLQPCRDRMKLLLRFQFYSEAELVEVLRHRSKALRWTVDETIFPQITKRAKGTPRLALRLLAIRPTLFEGRGRTRHHARTSSTGLLAGADRHPGSGTDRPTLPPHPGQRSDSAERSGVHVGPAEPHGERSDRAFPLTLRPHHQRRPGEAATDPERVGPLSQWRQMTVRFVSEDRQMSDGIQAVVSVAGMARLVGLSRQRFHQLMTRGRLPTAGLRPANPTTALHGGDADRSAWP